MADRTIMVSRIIKGEPSAVGDGEDHAAPKQRRSADIGNMKYKANIYASGYFGHILTAVFLLMLCGLISIREYLAATTISVIVVFAVIRLYTRRISFDCQVFRYDGWFGPIEIPYSDIVKVEKSGDIGWPTDRLHGSLEYRITTKRKRWWVSLLWFNSEATSQFVEQIVKRKQCL